MKRYLPFVRIAVCLVAGSTAYSLGGWWTWALVTAALIVGWVMGYLERKEEDRERARHER